MQRHDLHALIRNSTTLVRHELTKHTIDLHLELEAELSEVSVDRVKIEQVFVNLLMNAIHAMQEQGSGSLLIHTHSQKIQALTRDDAARTADHLRPGDDVIVV